MDHVLIDMNERRMLGRGLYAECAKAQEELGEQFRYHIVYCAEAKGFAVYPQDILTELWLHAKGWDAAPLVQYGTLCKAMQAEAQKVPPITVYLSQPGAPEMSNAPEQNGVKWPQRGASARVFEIAQQISTQKQNFADKEEVVAAAVAEGINAGTAGTQYSSWLRYWQGPVNEPTAAPVAPVAPAVPQAPHTQLSPEVIQGVHAAVTQANIPAAMPQTFAPPAPPAFTAPHMQPAPAAVPPSQPFTPPAVAQEIAVQGNRNTGNRNTAIEPEQRVAVEVGVHVSVSLTPAIDKLEKLLQLLKDAQADFGG